MVGVIDRDQRIDACCARGFELARELADLSQLTDEETEELAEDVVA